MNRSLRRGPLPLDISFGIDDPSHVRPTLSWGVSTRAQTRNTTCRSPALTSASHARPVTRPLARTPHQASEAVKKNKLECTWQHVPRNLNARADLLANIAMDSKAGDEIFNPSAGVSFPHGNSVAAAAAPPPANGPPPGPASPLPTTPCAPKPLPLVDVDPAGGTGAAAPLFVDLSSPSSSRASPSVDDASEVAALASATAAYAAVAADARATIAGGGSSSSFGATVMDIFGTSDVAGTGFEARAAQASADAGLVESRRMRDGIEKITQRRFMVHVASWRKTEGAAGAAAAILYEEGSWRRLNVRA